MSRPKQQVLSAVFGNLLEHAYASKVTISGEPKTYPLVYPDPLYLATQEEKLELRKLKRSTRTLKTKQAKERAIEKLKNLQEAIRSRHPAFATDADIRAILSPSSTGVQDLEVISQQPPEDIT
jgi:hypothetical protein